MSTIASDIYFDDNYGKLYEKADSGTATVFVHQNQYGMVKHQFIKRRIPKELLHNDEELYDIVTPYGYGGPMIVELKEGCKENLIQSFH
ncbi:MAG: hypothetical protein ACI39N_05125, partial [Lachnospiraceae bacterium]